eukprot:285870_1
MMVTTRSQAAKKSCNHSSNRKPKTKKKTRRKKSSLSMRKKATNTSGRVHQQCIIRKCTIKSKHDEIQKKEQIYRKSVQKSNDDKIKTLKSKERKLNLFRSYQIILLEHELNVFIAMIQNENADVNVYKKKCEFYVDRLRFFKYCLNINEKLNVNLSGAKSTLELLQKECYQLTEKYKIW